MAEFAARLPFVLMLAVSIVGLVKAQWLASVLGPTSMSLASKVWVMRAVGMFGIVLCGSILLFLPVEW